MRSLFNTLVLIFLLYSATAQVAIKTDGSNPDANTMLDIKSTNKGVKFPRITSAQRKAMSVSNADAGLMVFDTDRQCLYLYNGIEWLPFAYASTSAMGTLTKQTLPPNSWKGGHYGMAVSISGDYAAVGAEEDTLNAATICGAVYIYQRINGSWTLQTRILAPDAANGDYFGSDISLAGDDLVVGAGNKKVGANFGQGAVYVFHRNGNDWPLQQKLVASDGIANGSFGNAVLITGNTLLVGAGGMKIGNNAAQGAAYVFIRTGTVWAQQQKLLATDGTAEAYFGSALAIDGDFMAIGAGSAQTNGAKHGGVYIFVKVGNTWLQQTKVLSPDAFPGGRFGNSVSLHADILVVGAPYEQYGTAVTGMVHVFKRSGSSWPVSGNMVPSTMDYDTRFGNKVLVKNGYIFVSSPNERVGDITPGVVHVYKMDANGLRSIRHITMPDATGSAYWATALDFDGQSYIMSSHAQYRDITKGYEKGVVFFGMIE
jgi:hypothetical protein